MLRLRLLGVLGICLFSISALGQANFFKYRFSAPEKAPHKYLYIKAAINNDPLSDIDGEAFHISISADMSVLKLSKLEALKEQLKKRDKNRTDNGFDTAGYKTFVEARTKFLALGDTLEFRPGDTTVKPNVAAILFSAYFDGGNTTDLSKLDKDDALDTWVSALEKDEEKERLKHFVKYAVLKNTDANADRYKHWMYLDELERFAKDWDQWEFKFELKDLNQTEDVFNENFIAFFDAFKEKFDEEKILNQIDESNKISNITDLLKKKKDKRDPDLKSLGRMVYIHMKWAYDLVKSKAPLSGTMYFDRTSKVYDVTDYYTRPWLGQSLSNAWRKNYVRNLDILSKEIYDQCRSMVIGTETLKPSGIVFGDNERNALIALIDQLPTCADKSVTVGPADFKNLDSALSNLLLLNRRALDQDFTLSDNDYKTLVTSLSAIPKLNECKKIDPQGFDVLTPVSDAQKLWKSRIGFFTNAVSDFTTIWTTTRQLRMAKKIWTYQSALYDRQSQLKKFKAMNAIISQWNDKLNGTKADQKDLVDLFSSGRKFRKSNLKKLGKKIRRFQRDLDKLSSYNEAGTLTKRVRFKPFRSHREYIEKVSLRSLDCEILQVNMSIQDGNIEDIVIRTKVKIGKTWEYVNFTNTHEIPFSTKKNFCRIDVSPVYSACVIDKKIYRLFLNDFMTYIHAQQNGSYDFSPGNGNYEIKIKDDPGYIVERDFYKEPTAQIIRAKVYSDLIGLGETAPNGLIQTEFSKVIPLVSSYTRALHALRYVEPTFVISKIENKERELRVLEYSLPKANTIGYVPTLDLLRYARFSLGTDLNILQLNTPAFKSKLELNMGAHHFRTQFFLKELTTQITTSDSTIDTVVTRARETFAKGSYAVNATIVMKIRPEPRYGIDLSFRLFYHRLISDRVELDEGVRLLDQGMTQNINTPGNRFYCSPQIKFFFSPDQKNEYYFRGTAFRTFTNRTWDYSQLQIGYSYFFTRNIVKG